MDHYSLSYPVVVDIPPKPYTGRRIVHNVLSAQVRDMAGLASLTAFSCSLVCVLLQIDMHTLST